MKPLLCVHSYHSFVQYDGLFTLDIYEMFRMEVYTSILLFLLQCHFYRDILHASDVSNHSFLGTTSLFVF